MKSLTRPLAIAALIAFAASLLHPPAGWVASPAHAKKDRGPGFAPEAFMATPPIATGQLRRFLVNPHGEVDALLLADGTIVKLPPHMSQELVTAVKPNDAISVRGFREPGGALKALIIVNEVSKQQVVERPPAPNIVKMPKHLRFATLSRLQVTGIVDRPLRGKKGEVNGVLMEDGTVVRFPPHVAFDLATLLQTGQTISVQGLGTENTFGRGLEATALGATPDTLSPIYGQ